jgi:hypothetical protein
MHNHLSSARRSGITITLLSSLPEYLSRLPDRMRK